MRTELLDKIISKYSSWLEYGAQFTNPLMNRENDPFDEDCEYETVLDEDGVKVILEYEFCSIFITGLTTEEEEYISNQD